MPALQVKDFPSDLYEDLRACASRQDRSLSQQTTRILREYLRVYRQVGESAAWEVRAVERPGGPSCPGASVRSSAAGADDEHVRIERRKKTLEKIRALPKIEEPSGFPSAAELVRQMREERDARLDFSFEPDGQEVLQ